MILFFVFLFLALIAAILTAFAVCASEELIWHACFAGATFLFLSFASFNYTPVDHIFLRLVSFSIITFILTLLCLLYGKDEVRINAFFSGIATIIYGLSSVIFYSDFEHTFFSEYRTRNVLKPVVSIISSQVSCTNKAIRLHGNYVLYRCMESTDKLGANFADSGTYLPVDLSAFLRGGGTSKYLGAHDVGYKPLCAQYCSNGQLEPLRSASYVVLTRQYLGNTANVNTKLVQRYRHNLIGWEKDGRPYERVESKALYSLGVWVCDISSKQCIAFKMFGEFEKDETLLSLMYGWLSSMYEPSKGTGP
jgi:hypothetical protein